MGIGIRRLPIHLHYGQESKPESLLWAERANNIVSSVCLIVFVGVSEETNIHRDTARLRMRLRQTDRHPDKQTGRQTDRHRQRQSTWLDSG